ncbi:MAG: hypothetical protein ACKOQ3_14945 [Novosphingobium sp.]
MALALLPWAASAQNGSKYIPIRLHSGSNLIPNIAGDGRTGTISLSWRDNGNAWGYDVFTVAVSGSIATIDGRDNLTDQPHTGEDTIKSVRFARAALRGRTTTFALIADRRILNSVPEAADTTVSIYALVQNDTGTGTPYEFVLIKKYQTRRTYCNAEMALKTELGLPLSRSYQGPKSVNGC